MTLAEVKKLIENIETTELYGCDCSVSNVFLYQDRYKITFYVKEIDNQSFFFRYYDTTPNHTGWAFPIPFKNSKPECLKSAIIEIIESGKLRFCYCSENQKNLLDQCFEKYFPEYKVLWETFRGDSDYLYLQSDLSELPGKDFQKKRNHISRFNRIYENRWDFKTLPEEQILDDIFSVEEKWFSENDGNENPDLQSEFRIIKNAVENAKSLNITGGVLYIDGEPSAMCLASPVSDTTVDVMFEKAYGSAAENGAYAVINRQFAKYCSSYKYLNREEDLNLEGLRKAKLSWKPEIILHKFYGNIVKKD